MENLNSIGLDVKKSAELAAKLNTLLANYSIFYQNTRGYHWNIKGEKFFELHLKFEELYNDLFIKIDEVAERILTLRILTKTQILRLQKRIQNYREFRSCRWS